MERVIAACMSSAYHGYCFRDKMQVSTGSPPPLHCDRRITHLCLARLSTCWSFLQSNPWAAPGRNLVGGIQCAGCCSPLFLSTRTLAQHGILPGANVPRGTTAGLVVGTCTSSSPPWALCLGPGGQLEHGPGARGTSHPRTRSLFSPFLQRPLASQC